LNGRFLVTNCLKKARKLFKKEKSCTKSPKLLEGLKVAPNLKSCSKVAEQLMDSPTGNAWQAWPGFHGLPSKGRRGSRGRLGTKAHPNSELSNQIQPY